MFVPRWTGQSKKSLSLEVHGFADASSHSYAAVVYLTIIHSESNFQVSLICAKTKVAPVKTISIPRLELNAVVLLSRLDETGALSLSLSRPNLWIDRFHNNPSLVKTAPIKVDHLFCQPSFRDSNFVSRRDVPVCSFQGKLCRLRLSWVTGVDAILPRLMVKRSYLVEGLLHHVAKRSRDARRKDGERDFYQRAKSNCTSCRLYERVGTA